MASEVAPADPSAELATPSVKPQEISFTLPKALHTTAHVHLNFLGHCAMVFLATSSPGDSGGSIKPMGSFVYAMPDVSPYLPTLQCFAIFEVKQCRFLCHSVWMEDGVIPPFFLQRSSQDGSFLCCSMLQSATHIPMSKL
jgi:hypothetical protein